MEEKKLDGLIPAIVVPLKEDYSLDERVFQEYLSHIISFPIKGIAINTDAGEGYLFSPEERTRILWLTKRIVGEKIPIICGLGGGSTLGLVELGREFRDLGADYFLVFPHPTFKGGKEGEDKLIINFHEEISRIGVPLIIFQLQEALGGVIYNLPTLRKLLDIDGVVAIKEASFDALLFRNTVYFIRSLKKRIVILTGNDNFIPESFLLGSDGALIGFGSVFTDIQVKSICLIKEGKYREGFSLFGKIEEICRICFSNPVRDYRVRIKEILVAQKIFPRSTVRPPLTPLSPEEQDLIHTLVSHMKRYGGG